MNINPKIRPQSLGYFNVWDSSVGFNADIRVYLYKDIVCCNWATELRRKPYDERNKSMMRDEQVITKTMNAILGSADLRANIDGFREMVIEHGSDIEAIDAICPGFRNLSVI